jgi:hypothetical protein
MKKKIKEEEKKNSIQKRNAGNTYDLQIMFGKK